LSPTAIRWTIGAMLPGAFRLFLRTILPVAAVAACGIGAIEPNDRIDGWSVGEPIACEQSTPRCDILIPLAITGLADRDPGHAPIVSTALHDEGLYPNKQGNLVEVVRSSTAVWVAVFQLADGSRAAIGVGNVLGDPRIFHEGPGRAP
jgi:hypothetical protein